MIRINLVAGERPDTESPGRPPRIGQKVTVAGALILTVTSGLLGWRHQAVGRREAHLVSEVNAARRDEGQLNEVLKQVTQFEAERTQLQERATLIDELRGRQLAPVHIIDQVSRALPALTWLISVKQDGYQVTIEGECPSLTALSDFVGNLEATRYFRRPVEIVMSEVATGQGAIPNLVRFTIRGTFQMAGNRE